MLVGQPLVATSYIDSLIFLCAFLFKKPTMCCHVVSTVTQQLRTFEDLSTRTRSG